jgi:glutamyl-tRNA synthetase
MTLAEYEAIYPPRELPPGAEVTRVAPSPTGRPHIGTALQALIDRAIAQRTGGIFILRIEDTDQKRLDPLALKEILEALEWLGLRPDEGPGIGGAYGPYVQSERLPLYRAAAEWLVEHGFAYYCFCSAERLEALRKEQVAAGQTPMYDRHCQSLAPSQARQRKEAGEPCVVRLRVPPAGSSRSRTPCGAKSRFNPTSSTTKSCSNPMGSRPTIWQSSWTITSCA